MSVKQQVNDTSDILRGLSEQLGEMRRTIDSQHVEICSLNRNVDKLLKKNLDHLRKESNELKRGLIKCRDYIFNFPENLAIPSDNNVSERGIRKLKVKQKISGCIRSDSGADTFHAIHSIADTAWKNNQSPLYAILALI